MATETAYDYTQEGMATGSDDGADDFSFGGVAYNKSADEIEGERARRDVPEGDHEFFVSGFLKAPKLVSKQGYVDGKPVSYNVYDLGVRLSMVSDPAASVIDFFHLPTNDERDKRCFLNVSKGADGKNAGFMAEKLGFFLDRMGFSVPKGAPIPEAAQNIKNWKGRKLVATIELQQQKDNMGNPKLNPTTMEPYPPKASVKLFSYRPHSSTLGGASHPSQQRPAQPAQTTAIRPQQSHSAATAAPHAGQMGQPKGAMTPETLNRLKGAL